MIKTLKNLFKQDKERFLIPNGVQDVIPIRKIYDDGVFQVGDDKFSKTYKFTDINYAVASREDKEAMFLEYSELLNSFDSGATTKITINNRRLNRVDFEKNILIPLTGDALDEYRKEDNSMLLDENAERGERITQSLVRGRTYYSFWPPWKQMHRTGTRRKVTYFSRFLSYRRRNGFLF